MPDIGGLIRIGVAVYRLSQRHIRVMGSSVWPMANGRVFDSEVVQDDIQGWAAQLTYSYKAFGEYYSGIYRRSFRREKSAEDFLERLPRETPIPVRYKAEKPEISTVLIADLGLLLSGLK
jgi:hypothetical protein